MRDTRRQFWAARCAFETTKCMDSRGQQQFNFYVAACVRSGYMPRLRALLNESSSEASALHDAQDRAKCREIWEAGLYASQPGYNDSALYFS
jgi:hypothetical protein